MRFELLKYLWVGFWQLQGIEPEWFNINGEKMTRKEPKVLPTLMATI